MTSGRLAAWGNAAQVLLPNAFPPDGSLQAVYVLAELHSPSPQFGEHAGLKQSSFETVTVTFPSPTSGASCTLGAFEHMQQVCLCK